MTSKLADLEVRDLMSARAVAVREDEPLSIVVNLMWDHDCGVVPVLDARGERVVGMITDRDICIATWSRDASPSAIRAGDVMTKDPHSCRAEDSIHVAENTMRTHQVRRLPVLDANSRLVGILSLTDIARAAAQRSSARAGFEVSPNQVIDTLAGIIAAREHSHRNGGHVAQW